MSTINQFFVFVFEQLKCYPTGGNTFTFAISADPNQTSNLRNQNTAHTVHNSVKSRIKTPMDH